MAPTSPSLATSQRMARASCPLAAKSAAAERTDSSFQSASTTEAPASAKDFAVARPSPDPAPVTSATCFSNEIFMVQLLWSVDALLVALLVADFLRPFDVLAVQRFLNCGMAHSIRRASAMPVRKPDDIACACPDIKVKIVTKYGLNDIVAERYDAGARWGEQVAKDMIGLRWTGYAICRSGLQDLFRQVSTAAAAAGLVSHQCINLRLPTFGNLYAWEFEKGGAAR